MTTVVGTGREIQTSFDIMLLWWLVLGVPLAWAKGTLVDATEFYSWIGVDFQMIPGGRA